MYIIQFVKKWILLVNVVSYINCIYLHVCINLHYWILFYDKGTKVRFHFFMGTCGVQDKMGISATGETDANVKRSMLGNAQKVVALSNNGH